MALSSCVQKGAGDARLAADTAAEACRRQCAAASAWQCEAACGCTSTRTGLFLVPKAHVVHILKIQGLRLEIHSRAVGQAGLSKSTRTCCAGERPAGVMSRSVCVEYGAASAGAGAPLRGLDCRPTGVNSGRIVFLAMSLTLGTLASALGARCRLGSAVCACAAGGGAVAASAAHEMLCRCTR